MIERYAAWVVRNRWLVIILSVISILALASGGKNLSFTNDYRVFFSKENPQLLAFEELQEAYTKSDNVLIMLEPKDGDVFSPETLAAVADLTDRAWQTHPKTNDIEGLPVESAPVKSFLVFIITCGESETKP